MPDHQIRPFADFLAELNDGASHDELSDALNEVVAAVGLTGKVGTVTYTLKIRPAGRNAAGMVTITDDVKTKIPAGDRADSVWFVDAAGNVSRHNPNQMHLPLREVPAPAKARRHVDAEDIG